ncbi:DUF3870 domain-containing protein [Sporolactobacillus vineae]|uniref:DUF3870 domain-containing protein n=1 Tax=Sporolactobacillus vineae TaxID=444463 RepID=UPI000287DD8A|nr:DUF3870 domain-containing protein [Sporolactobacillus vineae]
MFSKNTIFVIGDSKSSRNNPITLRYNQFFLGLVIDMSSGRIVDAECSATIGLTNRFIHSLFVDQLMDDPAILENISNRYFGSSQKALIVAYNDALKKYNQISAALSSNQT